MNPSFLIQCCLILLPCSSNGFLYAVRQFVSAKGRLLCGSEPASNVLIKLVDKDRGIDIDDTMARTKTNANGEFQLNGTSSEVGNIDPYLKIFHDCLDASVPCQRKLKLRIPEKYISRTNETEVVDVGTLNLEVHVLKEARDCVT